MFDVGIGNLTQLIQYKLSETEGLFVEVPTRKVKPSQTCPNCGHQEKKDLSVRTHCCEQCGYTEDRDVAAAQVMLNWALGTRVFRCGEEGSTWTHCGGFKQLSSSKH